MKRRPLAGYDRLLENGHPDAQFDLASLYYEGVHVEKNPVSAFNLWMKAATNNSQPPCSSLSKAEFRIARCYHNGEGARQDEELAIQWYRKAGGRNHVEAQFELSKIYFSRDQREETVHWWRKAAENKHKEALFNLGKCYEQGFGLEKDEQQAMVWYIRAVEQGNDQAGKAIGELLVKRPSLARDLFSILRESTTQSSLTGRGSKRKTLEGQTNESDSPPKPKENKTSHPSVAETFRYRLPNQPPPIENSYLPVGTELKVPGDGSCLFWSVAIGVLAPVLHNPEKYRSAFNSLFVSDSKDAKLFTEHGDRFKNRIQAFLNTNDTSLISKQGDTDFLYQLINRYFRQKVANYIDSDSELKGFITENDYVTKLRKETFWGGEIEIRAIFKLLEENYRLYVENTTIELGDLEKPTIHLIYTNFQKKAEDIKNHYNLRMPTISLGHRMNRNPQRSIMSL